MERIIDTEISFNQTIASFEELNIHQDLLRGIYGFGIEKPSIIQQMGIMPIKNGRDTIIHAKSGAGKTIAFSIGLLSMIDNKIPECQAIILVPTRELAVGIKRVIVCLGQHTGIMCQSVTGGTGIRAQKQKLSKGGIHIITGTPGRIHSMIEFKVLKTNHLKILILDQCDELLSRGFKDQIFQILNILSSDIQIIVLSSTMPSEIEQLAIKFMRDPAKIQLYREELTLDGIKQYIISADKDQWKLSTLEELYGEIKIKQQSIIFCNSQKSVQKVTEKLIEMKLAVSSIHGQLKQEERSLIIKEFRSGSIMVLVTTDLIRGASLNAGLFINYDLPRSKETYIHRIGRSGCYGRKVIAVSFVLPEEQADLKELETFYSTTIN